MKTILMICPFARPNIGGVESHIEKLLAYLDKKACRVVLVTYQPLTTNAWGERFETRGNAEIHRVSWFGRGWFPKLEPYFPLVFLYLFPGLLVKSLFLMSKYRREIDCAHAHGLAAAAVARILKLVFGKRTVVSTHAIYSFENRRLLASIIKWLLKDFDGILAVGEPSRRELERIGLDGGRIRIHPNWIDTESFTTLDRDECARAIGLARGRFRVLFIGRLMEKKGVRVLLGAAQKLKGDIDFLFVGDGPLAAEVRGAAAEDPRIKCLGKLPDSMLSAAYNAADLFVSPVLYEEGFATVYLESLACGTPVVSANRGCLPFFLGPEVADLMNEVDPDRVAKAIQAHYESRERLSRRRERCRTYAVEKFSERNAEAIFACY